MLIFIVVMYVQNEEQQYGGSVKCKYDSYCTTTIDEGTKT
jgi:hypothetical protein